MFRDDTDRNRFVERLGEVLSSPNTVCHAWALMPNHFHLLLKTGDVPLWPFIQDIDILIKKRYPIIHFHLTLSFEQPTS